MPPEEFVALVLDLRPCHQTQVLELVHGRHEHNPSQRMRPERAWSRFEALLSAALSDQRPMTRERLRSAIAHNLTVLRDAHDEESVE